MNFQFLLTDLHFILSSLTPKRMGHIFSAFLSHWFSKLTSHPIIFGLPFCCSIEPTNRCNLRCKECPSGMDTLKREKGDLTLDDFKDIIDHIYQHTLYLNLYLQGEPLLNKNLAHMIRYASDLRIYTSLSTNGHFLNKSFSENLVSAGLKKIIISVDGVTQESYERYRQNGNLKRVLEGISNLVEARKIAHVNYPLIVIQFIVFRTNEDEVSEIKRLGKDIKADKVEIKTAQHYNLSMKNELITTLEKYRRYKLDEQGNWVLKKPLKKGCRRLWTTAVITWNRILIPCCYDKDASFSLGEIKGDNLQYLWKEKKLNHIRSQVLKNKLSMEICNNCGENL